MRYFSLFSGIGGFELGFQKATKISNLRSVQQENPDRPKPQYGSADELGRWECVGYSEIDKYAIQIYKKHFPKHKNYRDAKRIAWEEVPNFELLVAGFPCQSFSIAGKRGGFEDTRGTLFFEIARAIGIKRPKLLLLENVKGLLSHDKGRTFGIILATLSELGYILEWQVLNSKNFGVPQNRERVFIIGYIRGTGRPKVFPIGAIGEQTDESNAQGNDIAHTITNTDKHRGSYIIHNIYGGFGEEKHREFKDYSPTIRTPKGGGHLPMVKENMQIRRLTPTEYERLQGFPDGWTLVPTKNNDAGEIDDWETEVTKIKGKMMSDTQRYKCLGNAVTTNIVTEIAKRLIQNHKEA